MPSRVTMALIPLKARDRDASCASCSRRGTFATVMREAESDVMASVSEEHHFAFGPGSAPPHITRYCRRCWPRAQRQLQSEKRAARARREEAFMIWAASDEPKSSAPAYSIGTGAMAVAFHWSLAPGTWWREWRSSDF